MRVTMLEDRPVTVDGVHTIDAESGETYEMGDGVAASLVEQGAAEYTDESDDHETRSLDEILAAEAAAHEAAEREQAEAAARAEEEAREAAAEAERVALEEHGLEAEREAAAEAERLALENKDAGGADETQVDVDELAKKSRPELDQLAAAAGVDSPEKLPNKKAVAEAVAAKAAGQA